MKKSILTILLVAIASISFSHEPVSYLDGSTKQSSLIVKGESLTSGEYTYKVYQRVNSLFILKAEERSVNGRYIFKVNANYDYKVVFIDDKDKVKVMYINRSYPTGDDYKYKIDLDFRFEEYFAELKKHKFKNKYTHVVHKF